MSARARWARTVTLAAAGALLLGACTGTASPGGSPLDPQGTKAPVPASPEERPTGSTGPESSAATAERYWGSEEGAGGGRSSTVRTGRWSDRPAIAGPRSSRTAASTTVTPGPAIT